MSWPYFLNPFNYWPLATQARKPLATTPQTEDVTQGQEFFGYPYLGGFGNTVSGYSPVPNGSWATYRMMERTWPTLALGYCCLRSSTIGAPFTVEADKGVPDEARTLIEDTYLKRPILIPLLSEMLRAKVLRSSPFNVIWGEVNGYQCPVQFKYLLPEKTQTLLDNANHGNVVGVMQNGEELTGPNYLLYINEPERIPIHGHSLFENVRETAWWPWMEGIQRLGQLAKKAAGTVFSVMGPETGDAKPFTLPDGTKAAGITAAKYFANELSQGISSGRTHFGHKMTGGLNTPQQVRAYKDLLEASQFTVEYYDMANVGPAVEALINTLKMHDGNGFAGIYLPARVALEGRHGTKAESGEQRTFVDAQTDLDRGSLAACINQGPINWQLQFNFGAKLRDKVRLKPSLVVDEAQAFQRDIIKLMVQQGLAGKVAQILKVRGLLDNTGLQINEEMETEVDDPKFWEQSQPQAKVDANGKPVSPGNNGNGKQQKQIARFGRWLGNR
jgi:hypothetical protein